LLLLLSLPLACQSIPNDDSTFVETSGDGDGDSTGDGDTNTTTGSTTTGSEPTVNCDPSDEMSCPDGEKCTVLMMGGQAVYDCVPDDTGLLPNEPCTPAPMTGQDQCPDGYVCIAPNGSNAGLCLELCLMDNDCDAGLCTTPPDLQIPVCGAICDPLAPLCPDMQDCQRVRQSNFICQYPRPDDSGTTADNCNIVADSGCAEGYVCETGGVIPDCTEQSCCTALCDLTDPSPCMAPMVCGELPLDPQPGLENLGACYVPQ
jgi:hypothetical protein